jgi:hypothetical protein
MKQCQKCKSVKELDQFYRDKANRDGHQRCCKKCNNEFKRKYKSSASYQGDRLLLARDRLSRVKQREKYAGLQPTNLNPKDVLEIHKRFNNQCFNCKSRTKLVIDHHIAINHGATLAHNNAVLLCFSCNSKKQERLPEVFYDSSKLSLITRILNNVQ